jgi:hypothetical protein
MKTTLSKVLLGRVVVEFLMVVMVYVAFDQMTAPSKSTATALMEAVNKKQLEPIAVVEVRSAIRSTAFLGLVLTSFGLLSFLLLCSDLWMLWRFRQETKSVGAVGNPQTPPQ